MKKIALTLFLLLILIVVQVCTAQTHLSKKEYTTAFLNTHVGIDPSTIANVLGPYHEYLGEKLNCKINVVVVNSFDKMLEGFKNGSFNFGYAGNLDYIGLKKLINIKPLARPIKANSPTYQAVLIVKRDSKYKSLADLKGKKFAYSSKESSHGYLIPALLIKNKYKIPLENFFGEIIKTKKDVDCVLAVYYGKADATYSSNQIIDYVSELNPKIGREIKILDASQPIMFAPLFCYPDNFKYKKDIDLVQDAALTMGDTIKGKQTLLTLKINKWVEAKDFDYDSLRKLLNNLK